MKENLLLEIDGQKFRHGSLFSKLSIKKLLELRLIKNYPYLDNEYKITFVGCIEIEGKILFSFPYGVKINDLENNDEKYFSELINSILKAISSYNKDKGFYVSGKFSSSLKILEYFEDNGLLKKEKKNSKISKCGSIDWNKTIKNKIPLNSNGNWFYNEYYKLSYENNTADLLSVIYRWALSDVKEFLDKLSFKTSLRNQTIENTIDKNEAKEIAYSLEGATRRDRDRQLLEIIEEYIESKNNCTSSSMYTTNFNLIWEKSLQKYFCHDKEIANSMPYVSWEDIELNTDKLGIKKYNQRSKPEVDIIFKSGDKLNILDAKYYDLFNNGKRPGIKDIHKQLNYASSYDKIYENLIITNGLVFPYFNKNIDKPIIKFSVIKHNLNKKKCIQIPCYAASIIDVLNYY